MRKDSVWHRTNRFNYDDIADIPATVTDLRETRYLPRSSETLHCSIPVGGLVELGSTNIGPSFQFAQGLDDISSLKEAASLLSFSELKILAKEYKVQGKNKPELLKALLSMIGTQNSLSFTGSCSLNGNGLGMLEKDSYPENTSQIMNEHRLMRKVFLNTGDCIRLSPGPKKIFERVFLVFFRSTEWTEKSLTTIILSKISRRNYPRYIVSRTSAIFESRAALLEFELAVRVQHEVDNTLESKKTDPIEKMHKIKWISEAVHSRWRELLGEHQKKEQLYNIGEDAYLRRFSPAWVYTRIIHKSLQAYARFKEYGREYELLVDLLDQNLFHAAYRGAWYQRKALLEERYMWTLTVNDSNTANNPQKSWKRRALLTCEQGLQDRYCHIIYHYDLQKRIIKLERALRVVKREQHNFDHVMLAKPEERTIHGIRITEPELGTSDKQTNHRGNVTRWLDQDGRECRVEDMCLNWYKNNGWKGYHSEGEIVRTLVSSYRDFPGWIP